MTCRGHENAAKFGRDCAIFLQGRVQAGSERNTKYEPSEPILIAAAVVSANLARLRLPRGQTTSPDYHAATLPLSCGARNDENRISTAVLQTAHDQVTYGHAGPQARWGS